MTTNTGARQRTSEQVRQAAPGVLAQGTWARVVWGTVSGVSGNTCTFTVSGTAFPSTVILSSYPSPTNGDTAAGLIYGTDIFLLGAL